MSLSLKLLKQRTLVPAREQKSYYQENTLYRDLKLDLDLSFTQSAELHNILEVTDLQPLVNIAAVKNAVRNVFLTSPGQKILNPLFGLDLRSYLFEPLSPVVGNLIAQEILYKLPIDEPRVSISFIKVSIDYDQSQYDIELQIDVPSLNVNGLSLYGKLNQNGYYFV